MKIRYVYLLLIVSCIANAQQKKFENLDQYNPLSFIEAVIISESKDKSQVFYTMHDKFSENWVTYKDVEKLIPLISSEKKCLNFMNVYSSYIPADDYSNVGGYAILFINSFRTKSKIKMGLYNCPKTNKKAVNEILIWWKKYKKK